MPQVHSPAPLTRPIDPRTCQPIGLRPERTRQDRRLRQLWRARGIREDETSRVVSAVWTVSGAGRDRARRQSPLMPRVPSVVLLSDELPTMREMPGQIKANAAGEASRPFDAVTPKTSPILRADPGAISRSPDPEAPQGRLRGISDVANGADRGCA